MGLRGEIGGDEEQRERSNLLSCRPKNAKTRRDEVSYSEGSYVIRCTVYQLTWSHSHANCMDRR